MGPGVRRDDGFFGARYDLSSQFAEEVQWLFAPETATRKIAAAH